MNLRLIHKVFAAAVFVISLIIYLLTVQPSVSFWDCGEFIAASFYMQVPHPPGTPFFLLLGNIFAHIPFIENVGFKVNLISVFSSALSVLFLYLVAVKLINIYKGSKPKNLVDALATYVAAAIGAFSLCFSDTFWFNGVEAEVYAFSTFLVAIITYLILRWYERADEKDNEKYIIMIAYLVGLSTGVHLMSVLAIVPVVMVIFFRKYLDDEAALRETGYIFLVHAGVILLIALIWWSTQTTASPPSAEEYKDFDFKFKLMFLGISAVIMGIFWKKVFSKNSFYMPLIIGGVALFATYPGVVKFLPALMTSIAGNDVVSQIILFALLFAGLGYAVNYTIKNNKPTLHLVFMSAIFILLGFTTFATVIIRANQDPPMNENEPKTFTEVESYLNREQYGDFPTFKRRFATEPHQMGVYSNYSTDLDFFYTYQMNHMMTRYLLWNYAGREGWTQGDGANVAPFNDIGKDLDESIIGKLLNPLGSWGVLGMENFFEGSWKVIRVVLLGNVRLAGDTQYSLFGIPFLIGLLGIYFHFRKDWKMASVFMIMFILMGYLTAFYQNQQQPQPRERDYFYVGAFFVYSIWIAFGVRGLVDLAQEKIKSVSVKNAAVAGILLLFFILIPVRMLQANYFTHDRSNNWVPWDYSYNLLQSCEPNAVLFTNGDNDTFPLWYLQDVEGVRRDVKIVNLSLLNTPWYIRQLKSNDPYGVGTVNIRLSEIQISQLRPVQWEPRSVSIKTPVPKQGDYSEVFDKYSISDSSVIKAGNITWTMNNTLTFGDVKAVRVQDLMVKEIIEANNWERPIYFAVTCSNDSRIGLGDYLKMEGMGFKIVPEKRTPGKEFVNAEMLEAQLNENPGYSKEFKPGFKFRGLNDPTIFFDSNHKRMVQNYRNAFMRLAVYYHNIGKNSRVAEVLDDMDEKLPYHILGIDNGLLFEIGNLYQLSGADGRYVEIAKVIEKNALLALEQNPGDVNSYYNPYRILLETYENLKDYNKLLGVWRRLEIIYPNDPSVKASIQKYQQLTAGQDSLNN